MEKFEINILGCGSALPTAYHLPTCQAINFREKIFLIDCGEGSQLEFRHKHLKFSGIGHIFISHLHGDHCFGLPGFVSTLGLLGRTADLYIHGPEGLIEAMKPIFNYFCQHLSFKLKFLPFDSTKSAIIYNDRSLTVTTIPLKHNIPCCGFLFREKKGNNHLLREWLDYYHVPISWMNRIKNGEDYLTDDGEIIPNSKLTIPPSSPRSYAYCSDTAYNPAIIEQIEKVDLLYHESTFFEADRARAKETFHSTASDAAKIAKEAQVKKLLLGHFSARYCGNEKQILQEAQQIFTNSVIAQEGMTINI